jgi:hypothetical protein
MRLLRNAAVLQFVGATFVMLLVGFVAVLAKPEWHEFFIETGAVLGALFVVRIIASGMQRRFLPGRSSLFERALQRESSSQKPPSQLLTAISMASSPEKSTFDLLALAVDGRLQERHGIGLNDEGARDLIGPEVYDLLRLDRRAGPTWALRKRSGRLAAHLKSLSSVVRRWSVAKSRDARDSQRSVSVEQARIILSSLEKL